MMPLAWTAFGLAQRANTVVTGEKLAAFYPLVLLVQREAGLNILVSFSEQSEKINTFCIHSELGLSPV